MGECFIPRKKNSSSANSSFAIIAVTYPEGSACTCSNGSLIFTDENTNGQVIFNVPKIGTWTVSCTDGTNSKSVVVEITAEGQCESVELNYALILFDAGDNTAITGGWEIVSKYSNTFEIDNTIYVKISGTSSSYTYRVLCKTVNMIPMDAYNQLEIVIDDVTRNNTTNSWSFGVFETITNNKADYLASITFNTVGTYVLDVSEISGNCYIGFSCGFIGSGSGRSMAMTASKVMGT